ncbi:hypothetical protein L9F63_025647, partial [Diploptera punctata]
KIKFKNNSGKNKETSLTADFHGRRKTGVPDVTDETSDEILAPNPGCEKDAEEYNMRHSRRGIAIIFNHKKFSMMASRSGTDKDCVNLSVQLQNLGFEVRSYDDLTFGELSQVLSTTSKEDHSNADCLMVVVMSHGDPGYLHSRDRRYQTEELWLRFVGNKCPTLAGKPKLFFIQACRGTKVDSGVRVEVDSGKSLDETDGYTVSYTIPQHADLLIAYSTMEGHYSWRNPRQGSWFIQALCEELEITWTNSVIF